MLVPPIVSLDRIERHELNLCLIAWQHKMGAWTRPFEQVEWLHGLRHNGELVAVTAAAQLMRERCGGFDRSQAFELGRVCAARPHINRAMLRLWREFVFPAICTAHGYGFVISYQDAVLHSGNLYRFDGWRLVGASRSGTDARSGRKGRSKKIWAWGAPGAFEALDSVPRGSSHRRARLDSDDDARPWI